jgi:ElaB/YqjD/DUF883 family membrane-anchored ribosome-binding protein
MRAMCVNHTTRKKTNNENQQTNKLCDRRRYSHRSVWRTHGAAKSHASFSIVKDNSISTQTVPTCFSTMSMFSSRIPRSDGELLSPAEMATMQFPVSLPNQRFALISCVGPSTKPKCAHLALRIYGTFCTFEEAERAAETAVKKGYNLFDLDIVEIDQGFFPLPPPGDAETDVKYADDTLNAIMKSHSDSIEERKTRVRERAEQKLDTRTSAEVFGDLVTQEARRLFDEWKSTGSSERDSDELKDRLGSRLEELKQEIVEKMDQLENDGKSQPRRAPKKGSPLSGAKFKPSGKVDTSDGVVMPPVRINVRPK